MAEQSHLNWHETSYGRYEREIDEPELFYTTLARLFEGTGRTFFAITGYVEISLTLSEQFSVPEKEKQVEAALRKAWRRLRLDHPTLASIVEYDSANQRCKKVYQTFAPESSGSDEADWLKRSFVKVENGKTGLEFCNSDPPVYRECATLFVVTPPTSAEMQTQNMLRRDLVFRSYHDIIDGIGTLILLNNLLRHASEAYALQDDYLELDFGDEFKNLSPPFRIAVNIPPNSTQAQKDRLQRIVAANQAAEEGVEIIGIPFRNKSAAPEKNQRAAITLTEAETSSVLASCKAAGVSVTQAFHAGIVLAVSDLQKRRGHARTARYINYSLINLRSHCAPPYNSSQHAAAVYHSASGKNLVVDVTIPAEISPLATTEQLKAEYTTILHQVQDFYLSVQTDPDHVGMVPLYYSVKYPPYPEQLSEVPAPNQKPSVSISSMGIVDRIIQPQHGLFRVENPWVTGEELGTGLGVFLATWKGRLCVSAGYNKAYHGEEEVVGFLERLKRITIRALE